jgi:hypothetical protein
VFPVAATVFELRGAAFVVKLHAGALPVVPRTKPDGADTPTLATLNPVGAAQVVPGNGVVQKAISIPPVVDAVVKVSV